MSYLSNMTVYWLGKHKSHLTRQQLINIKNAMYPYITCKDFEVEFREYPAGKNSEYMMEVELKQPKDLTNYFENKYQENPGY